jgi:hypothetical protein
VNAYIADFYNTVRLHSTAGDKPPAERYAELRKTA